MFNFVGHRELKFTNASLQNILLQELNSTVQDLLSHINVSMVSFLQSLLLLFHFCVFLSQVSELVWKLAEEKSLQSASKRFPSFGPPTNGNKRFKRQKIPNSPTITQKAKPVFKQCMQTGLVFFLKYYIAYASVLLSKFRNHAVVFLVCRLFYNHH